MHRRVANALTAAIVLSSLAMAAVAVRRELFPRSERAVELDRPEFVPNWRDALPAAVYVSGKESAGVTMIEFVDFECPVCAVYDSTVRAIISQRPNDVSLLYVHAAGPGHRFAVAAARAAECAASLGKLDDFSRALFARQDSLGMKTWASYAMGAGIQDASGLQRCATHGLPSPRIQAGGLITRRLLVRGTPTFILNGWKLEGTGRSAESMVALIDAIRDGQIGPKSQPSAVARIVASVLP